MAIATGEQATAADVLAAIAAQAKVTSGTYTGDSSANRAIAHGLSAIPALAIVAHNDGANWVLDFLVKGIAAGFFVSQQTALTGGGLAQTAPDATNFYVGNATDYTKSGNSNTLEYFWMAMR